VELLHVRLAVEDLIGGGHVVIPHARTGLDSVLEVGDALVVTDQDGEFHGASVVAVGGDGHDPEYHLRIGARLPMDLAAERMTDVDVRPEKAALHDVVDLLGELRGMLGQPGNA
jgi:hypothetical protein